MRIAVVHNLPAAGGARRRLSSQLEHLQAEIIEVSPDTARPITADAVVIPLEQHAARHARLVRPTLRYVDLALLERAWRRVGRSLVSVGADAVWLNPCRLLGTPPVLRANHPPALYFCDEPRRVDLEPEAHATRNRLTNPIYAPLYNRQRHLDQRAAAATRRIATNSRYTATQIQRAYGRDAEVVKSGVPDTLLEVSCNAPREDFLLSVGTLIPSKGHDIVVRAAGFAASRPYVTVVAPRPDPGEQARLAALARDAGTQLSFRIGVTDEELTQLYCTARVTACIGPSRATRARLT